MEIEGCFTFDELYHINPITGLVDINTFPLLSDAIWAKLLLEASEILLRLTTVCGVPNVVPVSDLSV